MLRLLGLTFLFNLILIECLVQDLTVRQLDPKVIERKRQDTLEMCRIFNDAQHDRGEIQDHTGRRSKRDVDDSPADHDEAVERIVDQVYDELAEKGETVNYRRRFITTSAPVANKSEGKPSRRYNFAPAFLQGPGETKEDVDPPHDDDVTDTIDWPKKWPEGIIPYFIDPKTYDDQLAETMLEAFDYFEKSTCIRLQRLREMPRDAKSMHYVEWLYITNPSGIRQCVHSNARKRNIGVQVIVFGYDCMNKGEIVHEIMHVLGFTHEHTRPDRDRFVTVLWDNIKPGYKKYFSLRNKDLATVLDYDYDSVLHYPQRAFSKNGKPTLLVQSGVRIGQREVLSSTDVKKVDLIFGRDCITRNKNYLQETCSKAVNIESKASATATDDEIKDYFKDRIWEKGIVHYKLRDRIEFSIEERENINAVIRHIEKETCIQFVENSDKASEAKEENEIRESDDTTTSPHEGPLKNEEPHEGPLKNDEPHETKLSYGFNMTDGVAMEERLEENPENEEDLSNIANNTMHESLITQNSAKLTDEFNATDGVAIEERLEEHTEDGAYFNFTEPDNLVPAENRRRKSLYKKIPQSIKNKLFKKISQKFRRSDYEKLRIPQSVKNKLIEKWSQRYRRSHLGPTRRSDPVMLILDRTKDKAECLCPDPPGRPTGEKVLELGSDCFNSVNDLLHVFVHVLGLDHQHNTHDRDDYLHINWDKLTPDLKEEMKQDQELLHPAASVGFPYDYQSVMHFPWLQIKDGVTSVMYPIWNDGWAMGHWQGLSSTDVQKLKKLYEPECEKREGKTKPDSEDEKKKEKGEGEGEEKTNQTSRRNRFGK